MPVSQANLDNELHPAAPHVDCFLVNLTHVEALAFDVHGELLFMADNQRGTIERVQLIQGHPQSVISLNAGTVRGSV